MIRDLSETLQAMLDESETLRESLRLDPDSSAWVAWNNRFKDLFDAHVSFDRPDESFNPSPPTLNLFLYEVREDMELRSNEPVITRQNGHAQIQRPPLRVACSYLVTAWVGSGADAVLREHELLSQALQLLAMWPKIPEPYLKGSLGNQQPPLPLVTARMDGVKNPHEFWTAIGNRMRPSITITATIGIDLSMPETAPLAITHEVRLGERVANGARQLKPATVQTMYSIIGQVTNDSGFPMPFAAVTLTQLGKTAQTDENGMYHLGALNAGRYSLRVQAEGVTENVVIEVPAPAGNNYNVQF